MNSWEEFKVPPIPPQAGTTFNIMRRGVSDFESLPYAPVDIRVVTKTNEGFRIFITNRTEEPVTIAPGDLIGQWVHVEAEIQDPKT